MTDKETIAALTLDRDQWKRTAELLHQESEDFAVENERRLERISELEADNEALRLDNAALLRIKATSNDVEAKLEAERDLARRQLAECNEFVYEPDKWNRSEPRSHREVEGGRRGACQDHRQIQHATRHANDCRRRPPGPSAGETMKLFNMSVNCIAFFFCVHLYLTGSSAIERAFDLTFAMLNAAYVFARAAEKP